MPVGLVAEIRRASRALVRILLVGVLPLVLLLAFLHYPSDTDATARPETGRSRSFYEVAYSGATPRGLDYEQVAEEAARTYDIEGTVRRFVAEHGLETKRVLEVGSGRGYLQDVVEDYTGLDISPEVRSKYHKPFVAASATDMPFADDTFDAAWSIWVFEHIPTPEKALAETRRVVKPGGVLLIAPAFGCPPWLADGFEVRPYSDFTMAGKLVKASIPVRKNKLFVLSYLLPIRVIRGAAYAMNGGDEPLRFRRLDPNYDVYWQADSDAAVSLDRYEMQQWFESRGDECLSCGGLFQDLGDLGYALVIRVNKG